MKVVSVMGVKGGIGKSAIAIHLALQLGKSKRCVFIDLDPQASSTDFFMRETPLEIISKRNSYHVLSEEMDPEEAVYREDLYLHVIPASLKLSKIGIEMSSDPMAMARVAQAIRSMDYDFAVIDSSPGISYEFRQALYSADIVLAPVTEDRWSIQGAALLKEEVDRALKSGGKQKLRAVTSIVSPAQAAGVKESLKDHLDFCKTDVLNKSEVRKALDRAERIGYERKGKTAQEMDSIFAALAKEIEKL